MVRSKKRSRFLSAPSTFFVVPSRGRLLQLLLLFLLMVAVAQVFWWIYDQARWSLAVESSLLERYESDLAWARQLPPRSTELRDFLAQRPHLAQRSPGDRAEGVVIDAEHLGALREARRHRLNRYGWEGAFFFLVLLAGILWIFGALRQEAALRRRQDNFLAAVSHELRSPLASLRLGLETIVRRRLEAEQAREFVDRGLSDVDRLEGLVNKLLDSSMLEAGRVTLIREEIEVRREVDEAARSLGLLVSPSSERPTTRASSGPHVVNEVPPEMRLLADVVATRSIVRNLLENAVRAVERVGQPRIEVTARELPDEFVLRVADNGLGFSSDEAVLLFEKFFRSEREVRRAPSSPSGKGTGLGLFLVRGFLRLEGGSVSCFSAGPGEGAAFEVRWPRPAVEQEVGGS